MRIGVSGYFGYQNYGDEIFLKTWQQVFAGHDVFPLNGYENLNTIDRIIIGGGDLIIPHTFTSAYWRPPFLQKPIWVYGVGVPTRLKAKKTACQKYAAFLKKCKGVYTRDRHSREWLIKNNVYPDSVVVNDVAWSYKIPMVKFKKLYNKTLGISIRHQSIFNQENIVKLVTTLSQSYEILMIPLQPAPVAQWNDRKLHEKLRKKVKQNNPGATINIIPPYSSIDHMTAFIDLVDLYITERMHGLLMSLRTKTPVMPIAVGNKFYALLEQFNMEDIIVNSHNYSKMVDTINRLMDMNFEERVKEKIKATERIARKEIFNFKKLVLKD
ncbi:polysaccharide pyruvyl transferase family protein [Halothermothrix orenii]|uniref:Polysaccharide pyruvyl transferase domain-containing protein n=1 Tax=Halothermothrix orenii (strain H 168 / OCM 544 / DSM 9562) TaxID=373903 RepID=B8CZG5_HALOH|nr:polysaccharide pyruvyl transferase family protein [Halothermothrix orenii]ACL70684.1 hypothetical protein Hore_19370 [Halothermothrix orenii H 168]